MQFSLLSHSHETLNLRRTVMFRGIHIHPNKSIAFAGSKEEEIAKRNKRKRECERKVKKKKKRKKELNVLEGSLTTFNQSNYTHADPIVCLCHWLKLSFKQQTDRQADTTTAFRWKFTDWNGTVVNKNRIIVTTYNRPTDFYP